MDHNEAAGDKCLRGGAMKRILLFLLLLLLVVPGALAAPDDPEAFADWFVAQGFEGQEYHQWAAVLASLIDGIDRSREVCYPVEDPVYVAIISGVKYHVQEECMALKQASKVLEMDVIEAQERGFELCRKCK